MVFLIGLLTVVMVLDCLVLIFLVLIQLPKKEAGAGLAFGAGATDALFGAGSGTVLTKITKYAATTFFGLAVILSILQSHYHRRNTSAFERSLEQPGRPASGPVAPGPATPAQPAPPAIPLTSASNTPLLSVPPAEATNLPAAATNSAPAPTAPK
jgi:protein translocase SecG subunit